MAQVVRRRILGCIKILEVSNLSPDSNVYVYRDSVLFRLALLLHGGILHDLLGYWTWSLVCVLGSL